jgi:hypothetical protein
MDPNVIFPIIIIIIFIVGIIDLALMKDIGGE